MAETVPPWRNVVVRYCPRCRLVYPPQSTTCRRCCGELVDQVRRVKLEEK